MQKRKAAAKRPPQVMGPVDAGPGESTSLKAAGFYKSPAWRKARRLALQRDGYRCRLNYAGCRRIADTVHHVQELEQRPDLALDLDNLVSCCWWCHEQTKHRGGHKDQCIPVGVRVIKV